LHEGDVSVAFEVSANIPLEVIVLVPNLLPALRDFTGGPVYNIHFTSGSYIYTAYTLTPFFRISNNKKLPAQRLLTL
jgi:hypothetical protein